MALRRMERLLMIENIHRLPDWPRRLNEYLAVAMRKDFRLGRHDCCTFAAGAVEAMTGVDPMVEFRGQYATWDEARAALATIGARSLYATLRAKFGRAVPGALGQRGDVAYHEKSCGVVVGRNAIFFGAHGYVMIPITQLQRAFRVPF